MSEADDIMAGFRETYPQCGDPVMVAHPHYIGRGLSQTVVEAMGNVPMVIHTAAPEDRIAVVPAENAALMLRSKVFIETPQDVVDWGV